MRFDHCTSVWLIFSTDSYFSASEELVPVPNLMSLNLISCFAIKNFAPLSQVAFFLRDYSLVELIQYSVFVLHLVPHPLISKAKAISHVFLPILFTA